VNRFESEARAAVARASDHVIGAWKGTLRGREDVRFKGEVDLVTATDHASEAILVESLQAAFPEHGIVAEEGTAASDAASDAEYVWYIDPLDGTTNFAHGHPHFGISVALTRGGELLFGLVADPLRGETFIAHAGGGASLNDEPIRVSQVADLNGALLATGFPYDRREKADFYLGFVADFLRRSQGIRRAGTASLDLCYVACGRVDGFWEMQLKPWDTSAGALIVREAGGTVTDFRGGLFDPHGIETVASNGRIHASMVEILGGGIRNSKS
jgi:myo-inositol-1(or 4)-monophosphatase